jgi:hypothetical protein
MGVMLTSSNSEVTRASGLREQATRPTWKGASPKPGISPEARSVQVAPSSVDMDAVKAVPVRFSRSSAGSRTAPLPEKTEAPATVLRSIS